MFYLISFSDFIEKSMNMLNEIFLLLSILVNTKGKSNGICMLNSRDKWLDFDFLGLFFLLYLNLIKYNIELLEILIRIYRQYMSLSHVLLYIKRMIFKIITLKILFLIISD